MDLSSKCDQIRNFLRIWSHLLDKSLMENSICLKNSKSQFTEVHKSIVNNKVKTALQIIC